MSLPPSSCGITAAPQGYAPGSAALVVLVLCLLPGGANQTVYLTESGRCYHKQDCQYVIGKDNTVAVTEQQAKDSGYDACTWCFGHSAS